MSTRGEFAWIDRLLDVLGPAARPGGRLAAGDDVAVLEGPGGETWAWTADGLVEGVHFRFDWLDPEAVGHRALAASLSDLAAAIAEQASTLLHTSNLFYHPLQGELATRLARISGLPRAFFCNSGAEAVEACLKFSRRYWHSQGANRPGFVAFEHSFHGRTIGALSVTWDDHYRAPFAPLLSQAAIQLSSQRRKTTHALWPPKPNELETPMSIFLWRASFGM